MRFLSALRFALCSSIALVVVSTGVASASAGDSLYARPGQIVSVNGHNINFHCEGTGGPTVVFDAGWEDWSPAWSVVQPKISQTTHTCSYDRAGSGFSDPGVMPRTSIRIAQELHDALHAAGIPGPYVLVGHSFGSYNIRTFADR